MNSIKNSKKNNGGNLLPQKRPRLAKYIALAVMLHVAFVIVYIYFTQRKPEDRSDVRTPPVKVVPVSPKKNELRRHQVESPSAPSIRAASRPMTPPRLMALPKRNNVISTSRRSGSPPMNKFIHSTKPNLITAPARKGVFSDRKADREMEAWPEKQIVQRDMRFALLSGSHFAAPSPKRPAQPPEPLPISGWKESIGLVEPFRSSLKQKQDTAIVDHVRSPAMHAEPYLPEEDQLLPIRMEKRAVRLEQTLPSRNQMALINELRHEVQLLMRQPIIPVKFKFISPEQRKVSLPQKMHGAVPRMPAMKIFAAQMQTVFPAGPQSTDGAAAQKRMNQANNLRLVLISKISPAAPPQHRPFSQPQPRLIYAIIQKEYLSRKTISGAVRFETTEKATYLSSRMVWQKEPELLPPLSNYAPLLPELLPLIEDHLADMVKRLIRPALQKYSEPMVRILAKNLTYRDLGLESEGTKFLSGLLKAEIEKQDGVELLLPADVSRNPQIVIEGEMWDHSDEIKLRLWSFDRGSGRRISTADLSFHRKMVPGKVEIQPPSGENLSMIQRMVELMKQNFPRGGDFQLGVWPDKGLDAVYVEGESLMVYILPEKDAYLHVDYYQIDGKVVHLLPSEHENNYIKGGDLYIIGDPKSGGYEFKVSDPFGEELLVVVASQNPLGAISHDLIEPAEPYIKRLADRLARQRKKTLMAGSHYIILTKRRDSQK